MFEITLYIGCTIVCCFYMSYIFTMSLCMKPALYQATTVSLGVKGNKFVNLGKMITEHFIFTIKL